MGKHSAPDSPSKLPGEIAVSGKVITSEESLKESLRVIDESIAKHPIPPATVKE